MYFSYRGRKLLRKGLEALFHGSLQNLVWGKGSTGDSIEMGMVRVWRPQAGKKVV
jgi:hypothetical protein